MATQLSCLPPDHHVRLAHRPTTAASSSCGSILRRSSFASSNNISRPTSSSSSCHFPSDPFFSDNSLSLASRPNSGLSSSSSSSVFSDRNSNKLSNEISKFRSSFPNLPGFRRNIGTAPQSPKVRKKNSSNLFMFT